MERDAKKRIQMERYWEREGVKERWRDSEQNMNIDIWIERESGKIDGGET